MNFEKEFELLKTISDDRLGREEDRPFVIERLERTDAQNVKWTMMSFTVEEAKRICEYIQEQLSLHEDPTEK